MFRIKMGLTSGKESPVNKTVDEIELLNKTGKKHAHDILEVFRQFESKIMILKSEKELLTREINRLDLRKTNADIEDRKIYLTESAMQTDSERRNERMENTEIIRQNKQEDGQSGANILTNVACQALFSGDKYDPAGPPIHHQIQYGEPVRESETNNANVEILRLKTLVRELKVKLKLLEDTQTTEMEEKMKYINKLKDQLSECDLQRKSDYRQYDLDQQKMRSNNIELETTSRMHQHTINEYKEEMKRKINKLEEQEKRIIELTQCIENDRILLQNKTMQIEKVDVQRNELNTKIVQLQGSLDVRQRNIISSEQKHDTIRKQLAEKIKDFDELKASNKQLEKELTIIKNENHHLQDEKNRLSIDITRLTEVDQNNKELRKRLQQVEGQYDIRGSVIEEKRKEINKKDNELKDNAMKLTSMQQELSSVSNQLRNELSLEAVKVRNCETIISGLENDISNLEMELKNTKEENEDLQQRTENLREINEELRCEILKLKAKSNDIATQNAALVSENDTLRKEREKLAAKTMKKYISFHSVLKQPQSDQAVGGIVSLLQQELGNVTIEVIEESKREKNMPLLVVFYHLSRINDDAIGAMREVEASSNVALVVLHPKEVKQSSEPTLARATDFDFRKLGLIVDIRFLTSEGIMLNELTNNSIKQLASFINKC